MPVYNAEKYLALAIESILNQTYLSLEFIIIDDGSTDNSAKIIKEYLQQDDRIHFYQNEKNLGLIATLNFGLDLAKGEYIARMDADDISILNRFEKQIQFLDTHPDIGILSADCNVIDQEGTLIGTYRYPKTDLEIRWHLLFHNTFCHPCVIFRSKLTINDKYNTSMKHCEDYEFWSRLIQHTQGANLNLILLHYRKGEGNISTKYKAEQKELAVSIAYQNLNNLIGNEYFNLNEVKLLQEFNNGENPVATKSDCNLLIKWIETLKKFEERYPQLETKIELSKIHKSALDIITDVYFSKFSQIGFSMKLFLYLFKVAPIQMIKKSGKFLLSSLYC